ncbi:MAG TPA: tryptophan halogenase family protein [Cellvibrio sp.]|nr:tryptophan halogenase family protein [Cellvibrio sp.]
MQKKIVILGGGSAGWIVAARLAAEQLRIDGVPVVITLVESSDVPTIGVGEGTWPSMRGTLEKIGIREKEFLEFCGATFKQGSRFINWCKGNDRYDHPFTLPPMLTGAALGAAYQQVGLGSSFAHWVCLQSHAIDANCAPKQMHTPDYAGVLNYGYHLDAGKFAQLLKMHAVDRLGVNHVIGHFKTADIDQERKVSALNLADGSKLEGDFFIDASGTHNQLIGGILESEFISLRHLSPNDRALAIPVPYRHKDEAIHSATLSTAQEAGWIWDIGLQHRRGVGYVYCSEFSTEARARETLANYVAAINPGVGAAADARQLIIEPGYRATPWVGNCVAVGMAAGFIEPLEASALVMVELAAGYLCENLPASTASLDGIADRYNQLFTERWGRIRDFLQLHYLLSDRRDSPYWQHVTSAIPASPRLQNLLGEWRYRDPALNDFGHFMELFPAASYQYVLLGMQPAYLITRFDRENGKKFELLKEIDALMAKRDHYLAHLPANRLYFNKLKEKQLMVS